MKGHSPGRRKGITRLVRFTCQQCGKEVERTRDRAGRARFCSISCSSRYRAAHHDYTGKVTVICAGCGEPLQKWRAWLRGGGPEALHFHDLTCRRHYRAAQRMQREAEVAALVEGEGLAPSAARLRTSNGRTLVEKQCAICGQGFSVPRTRSEGARYCSLACKDVGQARVMTGRQNVTTWKSTAYRGMVRKLLIDRCVICGWEEARNDVCHVVARKDGGENALENVVMLCPNHHRLFDTGKLSIEEVRAAQPRCLPRTQSTPASISSA